MLVPYFGLILMTSVLIKNSGATSHWVVTEQGKIQAKVDSVFSMKRPYDLVAFMQQEERAQILDLIRAEMSNQNFDDDLVEANFGELNNETEMQKRFYETNAHCRKAKIPLAEFDLYATTVSLSQEAKILNDVINRHTQLTIDLDDDFDDDLMTFINFKEKPFCSSMSSNSDISKFISGLSIMSKKLKIVLMPDTAFAKLVKLNTRSRLMAYGKLIKEYLNMNKTEWSNNFFASNYWRAISNGNEALNCLRNAIVNAPPELRHIGLISLANLCHKTHFSEEAVDVLLKAIEYTPDDPALHFTLGNVYATLMRFNDSAASFKRTLELRPKYKSVKARYHAVLCTENLERMLQRQQDSLQETMDELRRYKRQHDSWSLVLSKIVSEQASTESKVESQVAYERIKFLLTNKDGYLYENAFLNGHTIAIEVDKTEVVENMLKMFEEKIKNYPIEDDSASREEEFLDKPIQKEDVLKPTKPVLYQKWSEKVEKPLEEFDKTGEECIEIFTNVPNWSDFPTVFVSPANRGFDVAAMFSEHVNIPIEYPAALPWYPPLCKSYNRPISKYDRLKSFERIRRLEVEVRSTAESDIEHDYSLYSPVHSFHEWGARITAALNQKTKIPEWITYVYAGTYWRIWGHPQNGLDCFKNALATAPEEYMDIVLTNLAGLLYKAGSVDDAMTILKDAHIMNKKEPGTNFALGNLYIVQGESSSAIFHLQKVLKMIPEHEAAAQQIQVALCQSKANSPFVSDDSCTKDFTPECLNKNSLTRVPGLNAMIYCKDGQCKYINPDELLLTDVEEEERVIKPKKTDKKNSLKKKKKEWPTPPRVLESFEDLMAESEGPTTTTLLMARDEMKNGIPQGAVEIGTIVETEPDEEDVDDDSMTDSKFVNIGPILLEDDPMPDVLLVVSPDLSNTDNLVDLDNCDKALPVNSNTFVSTWLSVSSKGIDIREYLGDYLEPLPKDLRQKPICDPEVPNSLLTMDHLVGIRMRDRLHLASEAGLKEALLGIVGESRDSPPSIEEIATRISLAFNANQTSWVLSTASALYWRVKGNTEQAVKCLRHALYYSPPNMRDLPLISLANIFHRAGLYHDALITANAALEISPSFVVTHFTIGNIYVSMGDYDKAATFYLSTLELQKSFGPARDKLVSLYCFNKLTENIRPNKSLKVEL